MPFSKQGLAHSLDMSHWRQEIDTFANETQAALTQIIDELSNTFSPVESLSLPNSARAAQHRDSLTPRNVESLEADLEKMKNAKS
jgi:hypothetical protein